MKFQVDIEELPPDLSGRDTREKMEGLLRMHFPKAEVMIMRVKKRGTQFRKATS